MAWVRIVGFVVLGSWISTLGCGEAFQSAGETSTGATTGTSTSMTTSTSAGGSGGSPGGSPTGAPTGGSTGTTTGSTSSTSTGTPTGTDPAWQCPQNPCTYANSAQLTVPCSECLAVACQYDAACCTAEWSLDCVRAGVLGCGTSSCPSPCSLLFSDLAGWSICPLEDECGFLHHEPLSCAEICSTRGGQCVGAALADSCGGVPAPGECDIEPLLNDAWLCVCDPRCGTGPMCMPWEVCTSGECVPR